MCEFKAGTRMAARVKAEDVADLRGDGGESVAGLGCFAGEKGAAECGCRCSLECGFDVGVHTEGGGPGGGALGQVGAGRWGRGPCGGEAAPPPALSARVENAGCSCCVCWMLLGGVVVVGRSGVCDVVRCDGMARAQWCTGSP